MAGGLGARPGQRLVPAEQDLREAFRGFLAGPVALQLTPHLDHASGLAAGLGDAVQPGLVRLGRCPPDDVGHQRAVLRRQQMVGARVADGLACHGFLLVTELDGRPAHPGFLARRGYANDPFHDR